MEGMEEVEEEEEEDQGIIWRAGGIDGRVRKVGGRGGRGGPAHRCRGRALRFSWPDVNAGNIAMLAPMVDARVTGAD